MRKKICHAVNCNTLIPQSDTYCKIHIPEKHKPFETAVRYNEELYATKEWRKLRKQKINEQPYCSKCGLSNKEVILHVHHIVAPLGKENLFFNYENLDVLCERCHSFETAREINNRKKN